MFVAYPSSSPASKMLRTGNIDTETTGTKTNNDYVQLYWSASEFCHPIEFRHLL